MANPAGLPKEIAATLLEKLGSDDAFRATFEKSPVQALRQIGAPDPEGCAGCMTVKKLASKEAIKAARATLSAQITAALMLQPIRLNAG